MQRGLPEVNRRKSFTKSKSKSNQAIPVTRRASACERLTSDFDASSRHYNANQQQLQLATYKNCIPELPTEKKVWSQRRFIDTGESLPGVSNEEVKTLRERAGTLYSIHQLFFVQSSQLSNSYRRQSCARETYSPPDSISSVNTPSFLPANRKLSFSGGGNRNTRGMFLESKDSPFNEAMTPSLQQHAAGMHSDSSGTSASRNYVNLNSTKTPSLPKITVHSSIDDE